MPTLFKPLTRFVRRVKKLKRARRTSRRKPLAERLSTAKRINHAQAHHHPDGHWQCCACPPSQTPNPQPLHHYQGLHPFLYLSCSKCSHVLCQHCSTTSIITLLEFDAHTMISFRKKNELVHFGQVCKACGLSHRGKVKMIVIDDAANEKMPVLEFGGLVCECGRVPDGWVKYRIGRGKGV